MNENGHEKACFVASIEDWTQSATGRACYVAILDLFATKGHKRARFVANIDVLTIAASGRAVFVAEFELGAIMAT